MPLRPSKREGKDGALSWLVSHEFSELSAMKDWGLSIKEWKKNSRRERQKMWAFTIANAKMKQADDGVMDKRLEDMKRKTKQGNPHSSKRGRR